MIHDPLHWHPYDGDHHHGVNPNAYLDLFGSPLYDFLAQYGEIALPWATSPQEEHDAMLNRPVKHGDALAAPIMEF